MKVNIFKAANLLPHLTLLRYYDGYGRCPLSGINSMLAANLLLSSNAVAVASQVLYRPKQCLEAFPIAPLRAICTAVSFRRETKAARKLSSPQSRAATYAVALIFGNGAILAFYVCRRAATCPWLKCRKV